MNKKIMRKLNSMPLTAEQKAYVHHDGAIDPAARIIEMDLMGIDQVLVIPTMVIMHVPFATNAEGVDAFCQAYNDFVVDWCSEEPSRLFAAAFLPAQDAGYTAKEIYRAAELGLPVGLIRPIDAQAKYPNARGAVDDGERRVRRGVPAPSRRPGMVLGMHTFPAPNYAHPLGPSTTSRLPASCSTAPASTRRRSRSCTRCRCGCRRCSSPGSSTATRKLKMAVFESNAEWLPYTLEDLRPSLSSSTRASVGYAGDRLPSEAFHEQCVISFESDEIGVFRQWEHFQKIGIWASDAYHHDGADSWSAMRNMTECGVPEEVQADLLGGNARRFYGIEGKLFVTEEAAPIDRPDWFPQGPELEEWADIVAHPRENAEQDA